MIALAKSEDGVPWTPVLILCPLMLGTVTNKLTLHNIKRQVTAPYRRFMSSQLRLEESSKREDCIIVSAYIDPGIIRLDHYSVVFPCKYYILKYLHMPMLD